MKRCKKGMTLKGNKCIVNWDEVIPFSNRDKPKKIVGRGYNLYYTDRLTGQVVEHLKPKSYTYNIFDSKSKDRKNKKKASGIAPSMAIAERDMIHLLEYYDGYYKG